MEKPRLIVFAGPNGSGKTSITEQLREPQWLEGCIFINPDEIAEREFGGWNSEEAAIEAANKAQQLREKALVEGTSLAFETVLSTDDKLDFIARAKDAGYFVRVFFVSTTHPAINASRITFRYMDGGHEVRISKIVSRYFKSIVNCDALANWVDRLYVFDNSVDRQEPRPLFRTRDGRLSKCYCDESETPEWALKIRQNLPG